MGCAVTWISMELYSVVIFSSGQKGLFNTIIVYMCFPCRCVGVTKTHTTFRFSCWTTCYTMDRVQWFFRLIRIRLITRWIRTVVTDNVVAHLLNLPIKCGCLFSHFSVLRLWCRWYFRILALILTTVVEKYEIGWVDSLHCFEPLAIFTHSDISEDASLISYA